MNQFYNSAFKTILLFSMLTCLFSTAQVIELGTGNTYGSFISYGPANTASLANSSSRYAYIFPASMVGNLIHGDSIVSLEFYRKGGDSLIGTCNLKIYMRLGPNSGYGSKNINWVNQSGATGMKKVYDKNPAADFGKTNYSWVRLNLSNVYIADTTFGKNLEILIEYTQSSAQSSNILWGAEDRYSVNGYGSNQCKYTRTFGTGILQDTTNSSTEVHPSIKINFPRYNQDAIVKKVYALGKIPVPLGNPDTIRAFVRNTGKQPYKNQKIYVISKGKNKLIDSALVSLNYLEEAFISLPVLTPSNLGLDTLVVKFATGQNNYKKESEAYRLVTENIYSYKDPTTPIIGGLGFGNNTTGDFVAKFYSNTPKAINQINVSFSGASEKFQLGIWQADGIGGIPKTNIWISDTLDSAPNFTTPVLPPVSVNGPFYVGVRQFSTSFIGFGYQDEDPVRPGTFYYTEPHGSSNWTDFSPDAPYKFAIEPRLQADNDIGAFSYDFPVDTINLVTTKTMAPKATIINYGAKNQLTPFNVTLEIKRYGSLVYTSTKKDTLSTLRKHQITFDSTFLPLQSGNYDVMVITRLGTDQLKDNDTLKKVIVVANYKDVGIGGIFDPDIYTDYEQFIDSVYPIANIQNFGLDNTGTFNVTAQIRDSNNVVLYTDTKSVSLTSGSSSIVVFKTYPCSVRGKLQFRIFTRLLNDTRKKNDTVNVFFNVVRSNDVSVTKSIYPIANKVIQSPAVAKFVNVELEDLGELNQTNPFLVYCRIYYQNGLVYKDSSSVSAYTGITTNVFFNKFLPTLTGYYKMICYSDLNNDQVRKNDTLKIDFSYGLPDDVEPLNPSPALGSYLELGKVIAPKVTVRNNGFNSQNSAFSVRFQVEKGLNTVYSSTKLLTLDSGKSKLINFDSSLSLNDTGKFEVTIYTSLSKDFDKTNDTLRGIYNGLRLYDVGVTSIIYPTAADTLMVNSIDNNNPVAIIENFGDSLVKSTFRTTLKIVNSATQALLYSKFIDTTFKSNAPISIMFPKIGKINNAQNIRVVANTNLINDQFRKNDSSFAFSQVELWYDAVAQSIALPINAGTYKTNSPVIKPVISIKNGGKKEITDTRLLFTVKKVDTTNSSETQVYRDSVDVLSLGSNLTKTITVSADFDFTKQLPGLYYCYLDAFYDIDQDIFNNHLQSNFRILDALGVSIIEFNAIAIYPNPAVHSIMVTLPENMETGITLNISDMNGKSVIRNILTERQSIISIDELANGVYFIEVNNNRTKIVVEH